MAAILQTSCTYSPGRGRFQPRFRLTAVLWLYALLASAMATFESVEEYACATVLLAISMAVSHRLRRGCVVPFRPLELLAVLLVLVSLVAGAYPTISVVYQADRVNHCRDKMAKIAEALLAYRAENDVLPPAKTETVGNSGRSWREVLLPRLASQHQHGWTPLRLDGPDYCCPNCVFSDTPSSSTASYFAVTGPGSAWNSLQSPRAKIGDNPAETILLLEELGRGFSWQKPRDLAFDEALRLLTEPVGQRYVHLSSGRPGYFEKKNPNRGVEGVNAAFADGSVRFIPLPLSEEFATALLTANGGESISSADMDTLWREEIDYRKVYSFSLVVVLGMLPVLRFIDLPQFRERLVGGGRAMETQPAMIY